MRFYTTEAIGKHRAKTPAGFLVCLDVPIARTGTQEYAPGETPIEPGSDGVALIEREPDEVFRPETIASANGAPFVDDHPPEDVTPDNWGEYTRGWVMNARRGEGDQKDLLLADIVVSCPDAAQAIEDGKTEISAGYDADYVEGDAPGRGKQKNIIINHVALVDEGRCGPRCSIGDRRNGTMTTTDRKSTAFRDLLRRAFKAKDEKEIDEIAKEAEKARDEGEEAAATHIHLHTGGEKAEVETPDRGTHDDEVEGRLKKLEEGHAAILKAIEGLKGGTDRARDEEETEEERKEREDREKDKSKDKEKDKSKDEAERDAARDAEEYEREAMLHEAPPDVGDRMRKARDSAYLADSFTETASLAEIIAPGIPIPTFDGTARRRVGLDSICALRRKALDRAAATDDGREVITQYMGGRTYDSKTSCETIRGLFLHVGATMRQRNADKLKPGILPPSAGGGDTTVNSPAHWAAQAKAVYDPAAR